MLQPFDRRARVVERISTSREGGREMIAVLKVLRSDA